MLYGIKDCANITLFDKATGDPKLYSDYANVSTNEWSSERVYANSKGTRSIAWDHDRQGTLALEMEVFDLQWIAIAAGSEIKKGETSIAKREVVQVGADKKARLSGSPIADSVAVVPVGADDIEHIGDPLVKVVVDGENVTEVGTGQFTQTGNEITFSTDAVEGTAYAVYYLVLDSDAKVIKISADKFPKTYHIIADVLIREKETGKDEFAQIEYPNARPQSNFTITMSATEPTNLSVTFDLFPNKDKDIAIYKIIGDE
ncbi:hypothetical protein JR311_19945 (plasmid) [Bacillus velezensis]|uniref:hypothetical protein n=1 Tax=Bacillus velezensis TaxID=492670 RepID=UPI0004A111CC|nr:hypothetical protein [Bacillus velezensis]KDN91244.1 hypothetical protein EF87_19875 [Bacillus amyloliquefaciens]QRV11477.1 hypothetical protein JR311_19945 [Bacillus velezensis]URJ76440.1 hypothetical protein MF619_004013 [Bacillus velezensis]URJ80396.1 hypothetical protein MF621_004147 [Bacillus velezensis]